MHALLPKLPARMPSERSRSRRERRADARAVVLHVVMPGLEVARAAPKKGETITGFLRRTGWARKDKKFGWQFRKGLPTILEVNGECVLRKQWRHTKIAANDNVRFVSYPMGGGRAGTKQVIGLVALVALTAFSGGIASGLAGLALPAGFTASATTLSVIQAGVMLGGSLLIAALTSPRPGATNDPNATTDQIYTVQAQGNTAKLGQPLPVRYGREKVYPDFAATPWGEFVGNDQYVNILLSQGMGLFDYEQILMSDTPLWNPVDGVLPAFGSAQVEFYAPGEPIDLFPINVSQSEEVTGQQLPLGGGLTGVPGYEPTTPGDWLGPYVANAAGTDAYQIAVDYVFPAGCFLVDNASGNTQPLSVSLTAERQEVNDAGAPIGGWVTLASEVKTYASRSPIRGTFLVSVPEGRYQVRFRRNDAVPPDSMGSSAIVWAGLRAYLRGDNTFDDISTIAIRIKATETTQGSYKFGVIATRKLPVWNVDDTAFVTQPTRNPFWAFLDAVTNAQYGSGHPISKVDFNTILNAAAAADARGDKFDYSFTSAAACPEVFDKILTVARSRHFWMGDTVSVVRDEWRDVPSMLLTDREIVRDSTQIGYTMLGEDDPDAVIIEYIDETTWLPAQVQYPPDVESFHATNPETRRLDGILGRAHVYRECAFYYLVSIYRRRSVQIGTEYEGRAITYGSALRVQSELPQIYGYGGAVTDNVAGILTLDPAPSWADAGPHFMRLRRANGKSFGPVAVMRGVDDAHAVLDAGDLATVETQQGITLANVLLRADGGEYPSFELGTADNQSRLCVVLSGQPNGNLCTLNLVVDDERVHATDLGSPPVLPVKQFPANPNVPLIVLLNASFTQGIAEPTLRASWAPSAGAFYYRADVSYDDGATWMAVYEGADNKFEKIVTLGELKLRVQAVGQFPGPFSEVDLEAPTIQIASNTVAYNSLTEAVKQQVTQLTSPGGELEQLRNEIAQVRRQAEQALARGAIDKREVRSQQYSLYGNNKAFIENVQTTSVAADAAMASSISTLGATVAGNTSSINTNATAISTLSGSLSSLSSTVSAQAGTIGSMSASITANSSAIATLNGYAAAQYSVTLNVNGYATGFNLVNGGGGISSFAIQADKFYWQMPGYNGGTPITPVAFGTVNGVAAFGFNGNMYLDGTFHARAVIAGTITGTMINAGAINTTQLAINSVDITKIIAGAVSNVDYSTAPANGVGLLNVTRTVNIQSGIATITFCSSWEWTSPLSTPVTGSVKLTIDGVLFKTWTWRSTQQGTSWYLQNPITVQISKTGLSAGNHTFKFETDTTAYGDCSIYITDFRR